MEIKKYFSGYDDYIKTGLKGLGISAGCFLTGYVLYYRKELMQGEDVEKNSELKNIDIDTLEKIVSKIKDASIHQMVTVYDLAHINDVPKDDIEIIEVQKDGENNKNGSPKQSTMQISNVLKNNDSRIGAIQNQYKLYIADPKLRDESLLDLEISKIKEYGYEPEDYYNALKKNIDNQRIRKHVQIISDFKKCFNRDQLYKINFGEVITKNYLNIITNIYYLNLRKTQKKFKDEFIDQGFDLQDSKESLRAFNRIYKSFLKETRHQVVEFFKITPIETISPKVLLRIYPLYFPANTEQRRKYDKIVQQVTFITKQIHSGFVIDELYNDNHPSAITGPVNRLIDFSHLIEVRSSLKDTQKDVNRPDTNRSDRVLNKFGKVYKGTAGDKNDENLD